MPSSSMPTAADAKYKEGTTVKLSRTINGAKLGENNAVVESNVEMPAGTLVKIFPNSISVILPGDTSMSGGMSPAQEDVEFVCRVFTECNGHWTETIREKVDSRQTKIPHMNLATNKGGPPSENLYSFGQAVYYVGSKPFVFKTGSHTRVLKPDDRVHLVSDALTQTGGRPKVISIKNAYYGFELVTEKKHQYIWKSTHVVNQRDLLPV